MAFNILSGKQEPKDWSCGAADDVASSNGKPMALENPILGFAVGGFAGWCFLKWQDYRGKTPRMRLPENA